MSLYILHPVVVGSRTCCNDQIVITEATDRRFDLIFPGNDPGDPGPCGNENPVYAGNLFGKEKQ